MLVPTKHVGPIGSGVLIQLNRQVDKPKFSLDLDWGGEKYLSYFKKRKKEKNRIEVIHSKFLGQVGLTNWAPGLLIQPVVMPHFIPTTADNS